MNHRLFGLLALAVAAALSLPAFADDPAQPGAQTGQSSAQESSVDQPQTQTARQGESQGMDKASQAMQGQSAHMQIAKMVTGGEEADRMQFQALDNHLQMLERSINQLQQLSNQPEQNAADIARWSSLRDEHARGVADVVSGYFLEQRILPISLLQPGSERGSQMASTAGSSEQQAREQAGVAGSQSEQNQPLQRAYFDQLQNAHEILLHTHLAKVTSDPSHVRELRNLTNNLKQNFQQYQRQVEARLGEMEKGQTTEQASRTRETTEPGIDQPSEQRAERERQSGQSQGQTPGVTPPGGAGGTGQPGATSPSGAGSSGAASPSGAGSPGTGQAQP